MTSNSSRRTFLRGGAAVLATVSASSSGCMYLMGGRQRQAQQLLSENPISFASQRDRIQKKEATHIVNNRSELINAVEQPNTTIWIPEDATIDMTGELMVEIAHNVVIASNRNLNDGKGGLIKTEDQHNFGVFTTNNKNVHFRVTGVRLKGPRMNYFDPVSRGRNLSDYSVTGFRAYGKSLIVDHCEVMGWTNAAFVPGTDETATQGWFHHNEMHHNQMAHLGYPMDLYNGEHLIEWNYFDHNRHSIAGFGYPTNGYEARFNVVGPNANHPHFFSFDMHNLGENLDSGPMRNSRIAGKYVNVHHNVFEQGQHPAISLSGVPEMFARFSYNWVVKREGAIDSEPGAEMRVKGNVYGPEMVKEGRQWLTHLAEQITQSETLSTQPSPTALTIDLSLDQLPSLSNSTTTNNTTSSMNSTSETASPTSTSQTTDGDQ